MNRRSAPEVHVAPFFVLMILVVVMAFTALALEVKWVTWAAQAGKKARVQK